MKGKWIFLVNINSIMYSTPVCCHWGRVGSHTHILLWHRTCWSVKSYTPRVVLKLWRAQDWSIILTESMVVCVFSSMSTVHFAATPVPWRQLASFQTTTSSSNQPLPTRNEVTSHKLPDLSFIFKIWCHLYK